MQLHTPLLIAAVFTAISSCQPVHAQQLPGLNRTPTPSGWEYTQPSGPNLSGTPQPLQPTKPPNWGSGAAPAGSHYRATGSGFEAGGTYRNPVPGSGGKTIDVSAKWPVPKPAMARSLVKLLPYMGAAGTVAGTLYGLYELYDELGFFKSDSGSLMKRDPSIVPSDGGLYRWSTWQFTGPFVSTAQQACDAAAQFYANLNGWNTRGELEGIYCGIRLVGAHIAVGSSLQRTTSGACPAGQYPVPGGTCSVSAPSVPATEQELEDAIANYENPEILNPALRDASNHPSWEHPSSTSNPTLSGPSSTPGGSKQTNHPDGKVSTSTTTHNHTYNQNKTYHTTTTVTNIYNPTTDTTETTTEETEEPPDEDQASPTDIPLADVPELYEQKYPDGISGVWNERKADLMGSPVGQLLDVLMPNLGSGGTCPSWSMNLDITDWAQFGTHDISPPCWLWEFAYWCVIVSALLLARSLVFGG